MRPGIVIKIFLLLAFIAGCTVEFHPNIGENKELLVVDGMITDQCISNKIKLSKSMPIGKPLVNKPVKGAIVTLTDDKGVATRLKESPPGTYATDSLKFRGCIGCSYALHIQINNVNYETDFVEMKPVPPIDSLYYEKVVITASKDSNDIDEGCKIYLDSYDPSKKCLFYRWDYSETWEYEIPYNVTNKLCYVSDRSDQVLIKNTSIYNQARVSKYPVVFIRNNTNKLLHKYSILVSQYSLNESEFDFWDKVENISENVGGLYDVTPMAISGNIRCTTTPDEIVYGYFSVSAVTQKRLFVKDIFLGQPLFYTYCATDSVSGSLPSEGQNTTYWVIIDNQDEIPPWWIITEFRECADCTTEGTKTKPPYWDDDLKVKR
jgi:hypothetical protein